LPIFRLPRFKSQRIPESRLLKQIKTADFSKEKDVFEKGEKYAEEAIQNTIKFTDEIYNDSMHLLSKIFGRKSRKQLVEDFENNFVKTGDFTRRQARVLREISNMDKILSSNKRELYEKRNTVKKNAVLFINDLFGHIKRNKLISPGYETNKIERKIKSYSKNFSSAFLLSRKVFRNTKDVFRKSDKAIHSAYSEIKKDAENFQERLEEFRRKQREINLKRNFFNRRFESKRRTAKRLADEVSEEVKNSSKNNNLGDIIKDSEDENLPK
jgi:hypothetical protein